MRVLFDHQIFDFVYGGAPKYFVMMISQLPQDVWRTTCLCSNNEYARAKGLLRTCDNHFRGQSVLMERLNRPYSRWMVRKGDYDVFHQTNFGTYCLEDLGRKPMVTTYHDANLSTFDPHPEIVEKQRRSIERADAVICVSENTRNDLLRLFDVDERKTHVIYHGIEMPDLHALPADRLTPLPYVLFVGRRSAYKNFSRFIDAFSLLHARHPDIMAVCTSAPFSSEERELIGKRGLQDAFLHVAADEPTMLRLYRDALCFVFPSIYEGFGMPILEAWSCLCPVVLSNASCFPEIAGDAGLFFDVNSADDMAEKMRMMVEDQQMREEYIRRGQRHVRQFSWEKCAAEHIRVYESLM